MYTLPMLAQAHSYISIYFVPIFTHRQHNLNFTVLWIYYLNLNIFIALLGTILYFYAYKYNLFLSVLYLNYASSKLNFIVFTVIIFTF